MSAPKCWALGVGPEGYTLIAFEERHHMLAWVAGNARDRREVIVVPPPNKSKSTRIYSGISAMDLDDFEPDIVLRQEPGENIRYVLTWNAK